MLFVLSSVMTVVASVQEKSLVTVTLSTDKDSYNTGETADVEISITNGNTFAIKDVKAQIILPDSITLKRGSLESDSFTMQAGEKKTENISVYIGESNNRQDKPADASGSGVSPDGSSDLNSGEGLNNQPDTGDKINISDNDASVVRAADDAAGKKAGNNPSTGDFGYRFWAVLSILSAMTIVIVGVRKKKGKRITAILLCTAITLSSINVDVFAQGTTPQSGSVSAEKEISVNGVKEVIKAVVTYNNEESQNDEGDETVTVTFNSNEGTQIDPVKVEKGTSLGTLTQSYKLGNSFIGWYSDEKLTTPFFEETVVTEDITLYAAYTETSDDLKISENTTYYEEDCA